MFKSVRIQNFRQFKDLTLDNLAQINLITGKNDTGKTSLLEAMFLHVVGLADPKAVITLATFRGLTQVQAAGPSAWGWIFSSPAHREEPVILESTDHAGAWERLRLSKSHERREIISDLSGTNGAKGSASSALVGTDGRSLDLAWSDATHTMRSATLRVVGNEVVVESGEPVEPKRWFYISDIGGGIAGESQMFDQLVLEERETELLSAMRIIDDRVVRARTLDPGSGHNIFIDIGEGFLPINVMGQGFVRMYRIISGILLSEGGTVFIDEISGGIHYLALEKFWRTIVETALGHNVQIFATTHSYECIQAAINGSVGHEGSLAYYRLQRVDGRVRVVDVDDEGIRSAVDLGFEMR